ncbi:hypothetical protein EJ06DRAFT_526815 [Trichodelitschia bisporula]|uniref:Protein FYV10 n=1 Tax=Trichodelitschia bisporula TaxID=703511 RepID=A0A6G1I990_9PEZI|nr:hypothetical protein EJ06DRAFT_526815 [Trichodelitschia bisporula]
MAEYESTKLNPDAHLLLDQPLLRLPYELTKKNFRAAQRHIDQTQKQTLDTIASGLKSAAAPGAGHDPARAAAAATSALNTAVARLEKLKSRLQDLNANSAALTQQAQARITHLDELYSIPSLADVKYERWSAVRLDRLLVDYMLRAGYISSATQLAEEKGISDLVDVSEFRAVRDITHTLRSEKRVEPALAWCAENRAALKKMAHNFEFELRFQQAVELCRSGDLAQRVQAVAHAKRYFAQHPDPQWAIRRSGLLAFSPGLDVEPYRSWYSQHRWSDLADMFVTTHHALYSVPSRPLLHIALGAGLSALKTPACHSRFASPSSGVHHTPGPEGPQSPAWNDLDYLVDAQNMVGTTSLTTSVCPICSTELNKMARGVPYAHHSVSNVETDPVVLPNNRIYGKQRLEKLNEKFGTKAGRVRDPLDMSEYSWDEVRKVYIS